MHARMRIWIGVALLSGGMALTGCGGGEKTGNAVQMKDMEVVDGTATDAMTDLDGVQSEGTLAAMPNASNAGTAAAARPRKEESSEPAQADAEIVADQ